MIQKTQNKTKQNRGGKGMHITVHGPELPLC